MAEKIPVILDTDIGSDIDDAVALAYLLKQPRCELVGITTVTGAVEQRAACAHVLCRAAGREDIPIHCGAPNVLLTGPGQPLCPQYSAISSLPHRKEWPKNTAVEFLCKTIRERPGEVTLLTIGPFTNIALLFAIDPEIPSLLKQMISMAGVYFEHSDRREWNCLVDPLAAAIVYRHSPRRHFTLGLDVTTKCQMLAREVRKRFVRSPLDVVAQMAEVWFTQRETLTFHDPLAAAIIFHPELVTFLEGRINVIIDGDEHTGGRTLFTPGRGTHQVANGIRVEEFFSEYFSVF